LEYSHLKDNPCSGIYEGDPHSSPRGEAAQGEHPLDPSLNGKILLRFSGYLMRDYSDCAPSPNRGLVAQEGMDHIMGKSERNNENKQQ
jgi:hypothetical protein